MKALRLILKLIWALALFSFSIVAFLGAQVIIEQSLKHFDEVYAPIVSWKHLGIFILDFSRMLLVFFSVDYLAGEKRPALTWLLTISVIVALIIFGHELPIYSFFDKLKF